MNITWNTHPQDRFLQGKCERGRTFIRLTKEGLVDALYLCFEKTYKFIPEYDFEYDIDFMKERANYELQLILDSEKIAAKLKK